MGQRAAGPGGIPSASDRFAQVGLSVVRFGKVLGGLQRSAITDCSPRCCVRAAVKWGVCVFIWDCVCQRCSCDTLAVKDMLDVLLSTLYIYTVNERERERERDESVKPTEQALKKSQDGRKFGVKGC